MLAVAAPEYLSRRGEPRTPAELHQHSCINWRFPGSGNLYRWQFARRGKPTIELNVEGALICNHQDIAFEGALQVGILYAHDDVRLRDWIRRGRLKRVLCDWSGTVPGLFLYYSNRRHTSPALQALIDCLLDRSWSGPSSMSAGQRAKGHVQRRRA